MGGTSNSVAPIKYDVFLSFRGEDTRNGFTAHLFAALCRKQIQTFIDDRLERGDEISPALHRAIEESDNYVIVFSQNYASSSWCLDELTKIMECKKKYGRRVIPVFYKVDPSDVRHQRGSYADAFFKHEERFKEELVQRWKAALTEAAGLSGWDSKCKSSEHLFVEEIAKDILERLNCSASSGIDYPELIGIDKHIAQIQSMLQVESTDVRIIGIWGMGGIGKSTIARELCHQLSTQFSFSSLVENVQKKLETRGIHHVRRKYLSKLLREKIPRNYLVIGQERVKPVKNLLILDNVNNPGHLQDLIGGHARFGQGSRIIVTSRDKQVLENVAHEIYEVKPMNFQDSLQLFCLNAFKQNYSIEHYKWLSEKVLNYAKGIPLTLKVLGLSLYGRTKEEWESALEKLENLPEQETFNTLRLSYDELDDQQKDIFLDIACFYRGHELNTVKQTLNSCGFCAAIGMRVLIDRGLIYILKGKIVMHDLIQEMGREIVRRQCVNDPGKRSRLWKHEEIYNLLKQNKGTDAIQCIYLDMCQIKEVKLHAQSFKMMHNLRVLQFYKSKKFQYSNVYIPLFLESLPDGLRFLRWDGFPQRSLPLDFSPENLVKLEMRDCQLEQLWERDQHLPNLKMLDLSRSRCLIQIPDLSQSPNIEEVILSHCKMLVKVYSSSFLSKLNSIWLDGCKRLVSLNIPSNILSRSSGLVVLTGCCNLEMFSVSNGAIGVLLSGASHKGSSSKRIIEPIPRTDLYVEGTQQDYSHSRTSEGTGLGFEEHPDFFYALNQYCLPYTSEGTEFGFEEHPDIFDPKDDDELNEEPEDNHHLLNLKALRDGLPSLFPSLNEHCWLDLSYCESLTSITTDLCKLKFLRRLNLRGCLNLEKFPEIEETMENLTVLILEQTAINELPSSLHHLVRLEQLSLHRCRRLEFIPPSIGSVSKLCMLDLTYCESLETLPSSIFKLKLKKLDLHGCSMLRTFPEILEPAESFEHLSLTKTAIKEIPSSLECLVGLQTLRLNLCRDLEFLPNSIGNATLLSELDLSGCDKLSAIPSDIGRLSSLTQLSLRESGIVYLPESIVHLSSLKSLDLCDCNRLQSIPELPPFLKNLSAFDCPSIRRVSSSRFKVSSDFEKSTFKFNLTNCQELDPSAQSNLAADAWLRITEDAYRSVFFCFPGSSIPHWFPCHGEGHSITLNLCNVNRLTGFALCVVVGLLDMDDTKLICDFFSYKVKFESDDGIHILPVHDELRNHFRWYGLKTFARGHTIMWKYNWEYANINHMLSHAHNITFEISVGFGGSYFQSTTIVKECGICPLYTKEKDDNSSDYSSLLRFSNNGIEEPSGSRAM